MKTRTIIIILALLVIASCSGVVKEPDPQPVVVDQPETPDEPVTPDEPDTPDTPGTPDTPDNPDTPPAPEPPVWGKTDTFNPAEIVFSLGAFSDVHIGNGYNSEYKFDSALKQLKAKAAEDNADGLDATMFVGDMANANNTSQAQTFINIYNNNLNHNEVPLVYTPGNHDIQDPFRSVMDDSYFATDVDNDLRLTYNVRHCVIDSTHILGLLPRSFSPMTYDPVAVHWLDTTLASITAKTPERYVMVITHPMIYNTCYGSLLGEYWYTKGLSDVLVKYPQAVTFGGHLHFPLNDPRSIWQGDFTSMGCASCSYMAIEDGKYEDMRSATVMNDAGEYSQGLLLQFDRSGNIRIYRMDYYHGETIGEPWIISYPRADKTHLHKYNHAALAGQNKAPVLSTMELVSGDKADSLRFAAGTDDEFVHHYVISVKKDGSIIATKRILSDWYKHPQTSGMKKVWTRSLGRLDGGNYEISLVAYDSWDAASEPLVCKFSIVDPQNLWVPDSAGSKVIDGGSGSVGSSWLSYSDGVLSWTANTTGLPRVISLTLPNGGLLKTVQVSESDFKGDWTLYSKVFHRLGNYFTVGSGASVATPVTFGNPLLGDVLKVDGRTITNNFGVYGLVGSAKELVMDACVEIDYEHGGASLGLFFDGRKGQKITSGSHAGGYAAFLPELTGAAWGNNYYEFGRTRIGNPNYDWVWLGVTIEDGMITATLIPMTQKITTSHDYSEDNIIGIEVMHFSGEEVSDANLTRGEQTFTHVPGQTNSADYLAVLQANYNGSQAEGMYIIKK